MKILTLLLLPGLLIAAPGARAQARPDSVVQGYDDTRAQRLFGDLMSPFCPGLTLATCPSWGADSLRDDIRTRLERGESPREIRAAYAEAWGDEILGAPRWRGLGLVLWLMPAAALLAGALALRRWARRAREAPDGGALPGGGPAAPPSEPLDEGMKQRLADELARFDQR